MKYLSSSITLLTLLGGAATAQDIPLSKILVEKEGWREVAKELPTVTFLQAEPAGSVAIYSGTLRARISAGGKVDKAAPDKGPPDVKLASVALTRAGLGYHIVDFRIPRGILPEDPERKKAVKTDKGPALRLAGIKTPTSLTLWPDEGHLVIGEADGAYLWAVRIEKDGSFGPGDRYYSLRTRPNEKMHVAAMTMDAGYLLYACTPLGVQVFDPTGRLSGVIPAPAKEAMSAIIIGGEKADTLFVAAGDRIYARRIQGKAAYTLKK